MAKTITVAPIAKAFAKKRNAALCVYMDPQANLSSLLGYLEPEERPNATIYDALCKGGQPLGLCYRGSTDKNVKLCYGDLTMAGRERELISNAALGPFLISEFKNGRYP